MFRKSLDIIRHLFVGGDVCRVLHGECVGSHDEVVCLHTATTLHREVRAHQLHAPTLCLDLQRAAALHRH